MQKDVSDDQKMGPNIDGKVFSVSLQKVNCVLQLTRTMAVAYEKPNEGSQGLCYCSQMSDQTEESKAC